MVCRTLFNVKKLIDYGNLITFNKMEWILIGIVYTFA